MTKMASDMAWIPYAAIGAAENSGVAPAWLKQVKNEFGFQLARARRSRQKTAP